MAGETSPLLDASGSTTISIHLEKLRFFGLMAGGVLLLLGKFITTKYVPGGLIDAGYIVTTFHFRHTCVYLDYNPSRTISALIVMLQIIPLDIFIVLFAYKLKGLVKSGEISADTWLVKLTPAATVIMFICQTYFYMVFVNHPDDNTFFVPNPDDPLNTDKNTWITEDKGLPYGFIFHYAPYMIWQTGMIIMAIQHNWYLYLTDKLEALYINRSLMRMYNYAIIAAGIVYSTFVWSFIFGAPLWDTETQPGKGIAIFAMYGFDFVVVLIPAIFALMYWLKFPDDLTSVTIS